MLDATSWQKSWIVNAVKAVFSDSEEGLHPVMSRQEISTEGTSNFFRKILIKTSIIFEKIYVENQKSML